MENPKRHTNTAYCVTMQCVLRNQIHAMEHSKRKRDWEKKERKKESSIAFFPIIVIVIIIMRGREKKSLYIRFMTSDKL